MAARALAHYIYNRDFEECRLFTYGPVKIVPGRIYVNLITKIQLLNSLRLGDIALQFLSKTTFVEPRKGRMERSGAVSKKPESVTWTGIFARVR